MWIHLLSLGLIDGASPVGVPPAPVEDKKIGGDDVPIRYEIWEERVKPKKHDEALERVIRDAYDKATGRVKASDEDEEMLMLAMLL